MEPIAASQSHLNLALGPRGAERASETARNGQYRTVGDCGLPPAFLAISAGQRLSPYHLPKPGVAGPIPAEGTAEIVVFRVMLDV